MLTAFDKIPIHTRGGSRNSWKGVGAGSSKKQVKNFQTEQPKKIKKIWGGLNPLTRLDPPLHTLLHGATYKMAFSEVGLHLQVGYISNYEVHNQILKSKKHAHHYAYIIYIIKGCLSAYLHWPSLQSIFRHPLWCVSQTGSPAKVNTEVGVFLKGTSSIPSVKSTPAHMKEISLTCSLVINWIQERCL